MTNIRTDVQAVFDGQSSQLRALTPIGFTPPAGVPRGLKLAKRPRLVLYGQSSLTRNFYDQPIATAVVRDRVLTINTASAHNLMTGAVCYVSMPGVQTYGPVTVTGPQQVTMLAQQEDVGPLTGTGAPDALLWVGSYSGASWVGRLAAAFGGQIEWVCLSRHGDDVAGHLTRLRQVIDADGDYILLETGAANSINNGMTWDSWFPTVLAHFSNVVGLGATVILNTLMAPDQTQGPVLTSDKAAQLNRYNSWIMSLPGRYANVLVYDNTTSTLDHTSATSNSIAGVHHDYLHVNPRGARLTYLDALSTFQRLFQPQSGSRLRWGPADIYANGGRQIFDGLRSATGQQTLPGPAPAPTGTLDNSFTVTSAGGGASRSCACSILDRGGSYTGMTKQRFVVAGNGATTVWTADCVGGAGGLFKDRLTAAGAGSRWRVSVRCGVGPITQAMRFSVIVVLTMTGVPGMTGEVFAWSGRNQRGFIELQSSSSIQQDTETWDLVGDDFTLPAGMTAVTAAAVRFVMESPIANSGWTMEVEDICFRQIDANAA